MLSSENRNMLQLCYCHLLCGLAIPCHTAQQEPHAASDGTCASKSDYLNCFFCLPHDRSDRLNGSEDVKRKTVSVIAVTELHHR